MARPGDLCESLESEQVEEGSRESRRSIWSRLADYRKTSGRDVRYRLV
jgi:hypothetical protein